jgi:hypothetical protein
VLGVVLSRYDHRVLVGSQAAQANWVRLPEYLQRAIDALVGDEAFEAGGRRVASSVVLVSGLGSGLRGARCAPTFEHTSAGSRSALAETKAGSTARLAGGPIAGASVPSTVASCAAQEAPDEGSCCC